MLTRKLVVSSVSKLALAAIAALSAGGCAEGAAG
jgi:hypothetical protein